MKKYIFRLLGLIFLVSLILIVYQAFGEYEEVTVENSVVKNFNYNKYSTQIIQKFPQLDLLKDGDLLFRRGYGIDSTVSMNFSQGEKRYSHAGIIFKKDNKVFIIHSEEDKKNGHNGVYVEPIEDFLEGISIWAVYRFNLTSELRKKVINYSLTLKEQGIIFDIDFNLDEDKKMYCSEFIYKVINRTTKQELIRGGKHFLGRKFVTISDLYQNNSSKLINISHNILKKGNLK